MVRETTTMTTMTTTTLTTIPATDNPIDTRPSFLARGGSESVALPAITVQHNNTSCIHTRIDIISCN